MSFKPKLCICKVFVKLEAPLPYILFTFRVVLAPLMFSSVKICYSYTIVTKKYLPKP